MKTELLQETQRLLALIAKRDLDDDGKKRRSKRKLKRKTNLSFHRL